MRNFIELHDRAGRAMLVNLDNICDVFPDIDYESAVITYASNDDRIGVTESYDEVKALIANAGVCIDKGDPRLDTKSPLTMEDLKHMVGEPVWNSNTRDWWLIHYYLEFSTFDEVIVYNNEGVQESWDRDDLVKTPLYRMKQGMMFISGENVEVHE